MQQSVRFILTITACFMLFFANVTLVQANSASQDLVTQGRQELFNGGIMSVPGVLQARETFADAVAADATDQEAQAFYGVTHALAFFVEDDTPAGINNLGELFEAFGVGRTDNDGIDLPLFQDLPTHNGSYDPPENLPGGETVHAFAQGPLLTRIAEVLNALEAVQPGFTAAISADENGGEPLDFDYADIQILRAYVYAARVGAYFISAYDMDCDLNTIVQLVNADALQVQRDLLDIDSDFLRLLQSGGSADLLAAAQAFEDGVDDFSEAYTYIADRIRTSADWRVSHLFSFDNLAEMNETGFFAAQLQEIRASLDEDRPATLTTLEQAWVLTNTANGHQMVINLDRDPSGNIESGEWQGLNGCEFVACGGIIQDFVIAGATITIVLSSDDGCGTEATFNGTLSGNTITEGTYSGINCTGAITGTFTGEMTYEETTADVVDANKIFGTNTTPAPLDIRAVLPAFNTYNRPVIDTFPDDPILNGILPGPEPLIVSNGDATRAMDLMPEGTFAIPTASITIDGTFADWDAGAKVFDDIAQDDPERSAPYLGHEDLQSFWMAQDDTYYYFRTVYHDGAAPTGSSPVIFFYANEHPQKDVWHSPPPTCQVFPDPDGGGTLHAGKGSLNTYNGADYVTVGMDGNGDACVEWRAPKSDLGDLSGRFIEVQTGNAFTSDKNDTFVQFPGYSISGTAEVPGYTDGKILVLLYDGQDPQTRSLLVSQVLDAPGAFTLSDMPNMESTNCYLYVVWDRDDNGIISFGDLYGTTVFFINNDVTLPAGSELVADQVVDFTVQGAVKNVHQPDDSYATYLDLEISNFNGGNFPDDIDDVVFEGPGGIIASLGDPGVEFEQYDSTSGAYFVSVPGQPELGTYTITVTSGEAVRVTTDTQTVIREIPLPDETSFSPAPGAVVSSMTPIFSWDPVSFDDAPLYYRLQIRDAMENLIVSTPRTQDMTSYAVPLGELIPDAAYQWRVRISDSDDWIAVENRSHSNWQPFTMAATLGHPAVPAVDLDTTGVHTVTTSGGTDLDLWVKVIDHDGVTSASHTVIATPPAGDPVVLDYNYSDDAKTGFFDAGIDPAVTGIPLNSYAGDWTFTVTDPAGNDASTVDTLSLAALPIPDVTSFSPVNGTTVANTTPTFSWAALTGINAGNVKRYRVRIFTSDGTSMVWSRYLGTEISCTVPPGVLEPGTTYSYRIDAYDAHVGFDRDNRSYAPTLSEGYLTFTTGAESPDPYIDLDNTGVYTWNSSSVFGPGLSFWVRVFDPQGVPGNIASVKAVLPGGKQVPLRYEYNEGATSAYYASDTLEPLTSGIYTLRVEDLEGNTYETTEALDSATIGYPAEDSLTPTHSTLIGSTAVDFDWADVPGAAFYWVEIYDASFDKICRFATTDSQFNLPAGYLAEGTYYAYRISTRREFIDENTDNMSAVPSRRSSRFNFITTATPGSANPSIATNNYGAMLWHNPWPDDPATSYYWMAFSMRVTDADGPPNGIREVKVTAPSGTTFPDGTTTRTLSYYGNVAVDEAEYWYVEDIADPTDMPEGTYAFSVTDVNGNTAVTTDDFTRNLLDRPTNLLPLPDSDVFGTTPTISWDPVVGAASYRIDLYNEPGDRIYYTDLSESFFTVPEGLLEIGKTYTYRVRAHRTDPQVADLDNVSSSETSFDHLRPHFTVRAIVDSDNDGIPDTIENAVGCLDANDADTDDDGIPDGVEDIDRDGIVDADETSPCLVDTDGDGIQDGTESGLTTGDPDTDPATFIPDEDPATTTDPLLADTDGDGVSDGDEDYNYNGRVDEGEGDPNVKESKAMPWIPLLLLGD